MSFLEVRNVSRKYRGADVPAVDGVSFDVPEKKILGLVGESGSGKTTVLKILAGLEDLDSGKVNLAGEVIAKPGGGVAVEKRGIGMVFQHHALFPHLTVGRNVLFGVRRLGKAVQRELLEEMLELVGLKDMEGRFPHELSGGERQRVALARALAPDPKLLLLDEPFSSLDTRLRQSVRDETRAILQKRGTTAVFVTHDTGDALAVADGIVVMKGGKVQQAGAPPEVYHSPANAYVASFFGACNFLPFHSIPHPSGAKISCHVGPPKSAGEEAGLWVRPEDLELARPEVAGGILVGKVDRVSFGGGFQTVDLVCAEGVRVEVRHAAPFMVGVGEEWAIVPKSRL
ncbi:MAG: ABC transporter ATP-binding protein [Luteolibacter sp.]